MVGDNALVVIDQSHIIQHGPLANICSRPRTASPAAMTTIIDETPIGLHDTYVR